MSDLNWKFKLPSNLPTSQLKNPPAAPGFCSKTGKKIRMRGRSAELNRDASSRGRKVRIRRQRSGPPVLLQQAPVCGCHGDEAHGHAESQHCS